MNEHAKPPASAAKESNQTKPNPVPMHRHVRRWTGIVLLSLLALGLVGRVIIAIITPVVLRHVAAQYGLNCAYDRLELSVLGGDMGISRLELTPVTGGSPVLQAGYCRAHISVWELLHGRIYAWRLEADGAEINLEREADGRIPLLERFLATGSAPVKQASAAAPASANTAAPLKELEPPLAIEALRVERLRARLRDRSVTPELDSQLLLDVRLSDLGIPGHAVRFDIFFSADPVLDGLTLDGECQVHGRTVDANIDLAVRGLRLRPAAGYLLPLGLRPVANELSMKTHARITLTILSPPATGVTGSLLVDAISLTADGQEALGFDQLSLGPVNIREGSFDLGKLIIDGARLYANRSVDGTLRVAGVDLVPIQGAAPASRPATAAATAPVTSEGSVSAAAPPSAARLHLGLQEVTLRNAKAVFRDEGIAPATEVAVDIDQLTGRTASPDLTGKDLALELSGALRMPGMARSVQIKGAAHPFAKQRSAELQITAEGIKPDALRPYLDRAGIESDLRDGSLVCSLAAALSSDAHGEVVGEFRVSGLRLQDQGGDLLTLDDLHLAGIDLDPKTQWIRLKAIDIVGPTVAARREASGGVAMLGFHTKPPANPAPVTVSPWATQPATVIAATAPAEPAPRHFPKVDIGRLTWTQVRLRLSDQTVSPPASLDLADAHCDLSNLKIDLDLADTQATDKPGKFSAKLEAPGWARSLAINGEILPQKQALMAHLEVDGQGLNAMPLAPYLRVLGIDPTLEDGAIHLRADATLAKQGQGVAASLMLRNVSYTDGPNELLAVDLVRMNDFDFLPGRIEIGDVAVERPRASVARDADGAFLLGGMRLRSLGSQPGPQSAVTPAAPARSIQSALVTVLKRFHVNQASVTWKDEMVRPTVNTALVASADVNGLTLGEAAEPAYFRMTAKVENAVDNLSVGGRIAPTAPGPSAQLEIAASGVRAGALASYLPPGVRVTLRDGQIKTGIDFHWVDNPDGGKQGHLSLEHLDLREGGNPPDGPLLSIGHADVAVSRLDLHRNVVAIQDITVMDGRLRVRRTREGATEAAGIALVPVPESAAAPTTVPATARPPRTPVFSGKSDSSSPGQKSRAAILLAFSRRNTLPLVTIDKVDLNLAQLMVSQETGPRARTLNFSNFRLRTPERVEVLGPHANHLPPTKLELTGVIDHLARDMTIKAELSPFSDDIKASVEVTLSGIQGPGLLDLAPELGKSVDVSGLQDGVLHARVFGDIKLDRRSPLDFNLSRGFGLTLVASAVQLRERQAGPVDLGVDEIQLENARVAPKFGGMQARSLEISQIVARIAREKDGLHVMGCVYALPAAVTPALSSTAPSESSTSRSVPASSPAPPPGPAVTQRVAVAPTGPPPSPPIPAAGGEHRNDGITIHRLVISGIDARIEDHTVKPAVIIPLNGLDIEVHDLSTLALHEDRPIRYTFVLNAGPVSLPRLQGAQAPAVAAATQPGGTTATTRPGMEDRDLFAQIVSNGKFSLYPRLHGWAEGSINGLELVAFDAEARQQGVGLSRGMFDATGNLHLKDDGTGSVESRLIFSDLKLSEDSKGHLSHALKLNSSLDFVIGMLQDTNGVITIPLNFSISPHHSLYDDVDQAMPGAVANLLATALANAPLKSVQAFTGLFGLNLFRHKPTPMAPVVLAFAPGSTLLDGKAMEQINDLVARLADDKRLQLNVAHSFGGGDIAIAQVRANPSHDDCLSLLAQLRRKRDDLQRLRTDVAGQARGQLASRFAANIADATLARLRAIERELAQTEDAIDSVGALLRRSTEGQEARRTRASAMEIAHQRMVAVRDAMDAAGVWHLPGRVTFDSPQYIRVAGDAGGTVTVTKVNMR